jgi:hypothetical protein
MKGNFPDLAGEYWRLEIELLSISELFKYLIGSVNQAQKRPDSYQATHGLTHRADGIADLGETAGVHPYGVAIAQGRVFGVGCPLG